MNARDLVRRARVALGVAALASATLWGLAACFATLALGAMGDWAFGLPLAVRRVLFPLAIASFAVKALHVLWRARRVREPGAVALWLEERVPALDYALVTAAERSPSLPRIDALERAAAAVEFVAPATGEVARRLATPIGIAAASLVLLLFLPPGIVSRVRSPAAGDALDHPVAAGAAVDRLVPIVARVSPPAYSGLPAQSLDDPSAIGGLVASAVTVEGRGSAEGLSARLGEASLAVTGSGARWSIRFAMPRHPVALRLADGARDRLVILEPLPDSAPVVGLLAPAKDAVFREPAGTVELSAEVRDDFGVADAWFEYIVSSGEGESFTFRSGVLGRVEAHGAQSTALRATLHLEALALKPGDLVHLRAVARDRNDVAGPDTGVSETRTLRIARRGEYDSIAVEGAPPPDADKSVLSERMLILLTEDLQRRRPKLKHDVLVAEAGSIAREQAKLRKQVSKVIFARLGADAESEESQALDDSAPPKTPEEMLRAADAATNVGTSALDFEGDETPVVAVNRTLLEAYNAMWDAERELQIAEPAKALPFMRAALDAIQRARAAERMYLRGRPPVAIVDLDKVRLAGKRDDAGGGSRAPRLAVDSSAARRVRRLDGALALLRANPAAAVDSLLLLRVDAIAPDPAFAAALGIAIDSLRAGHDATAAIARARRAAGGAPLAQRAGTPWDGAW